MSDRETADTIFAVKLGALLLALGALAVLILTVMR